MIEYALCYYTDTGDLNWGPHPDATHTPPLQQPKYLQMLPKFPWGSVGLLITTAFSSLLFLLFCLSHSPSTSSSLLCVCARVYMCACVCVICMHTHAHGQTHILMEFQSQCGQWQCLSLSRIYCYFLRQGLSVKLNLIDSARLAIQWTSGLICLSFPRAGVTGIALYIDSWVLDWVISTAPGMLLKAHKAQRSPWTTKNFLSII